MLLAKSADHSPTGHEETLLAHTQAVEAALEGLFVLYPHLPPLLKRAARFHDFGKAAQGFQNALKGGATWNFRHEILSAAIFRSCFDLNDRQVFCVYLALLTHHKSFGGELVHPAFIKATCNPKRPEYSPWYQKWRELEVEKLREIFPEDLEKWRFDENEISPANDVRLYIDNLETVWKDFPMVEARGALVAADHLASAHLGSTLKGYNLTPQQMRKIVAEQLGARKGIAGSYRKPWRGWNQIQRKCAQTTGNAMLIAPTGSGKTEAALLWALKNRNGGARIFYILPYQVSINAMAQRIAALFPDAQRHNKITENDNVSALHSNVDLAMYESSKRDGEDDDRALQKAIKNTDAARKIYAPIKVTTVYQLLQIFFGKKFFEVGLLELSGSVIIFDEIHAYDGHTQGLIQAMLRYLEKLGARVLIMTATLPNSLQEQLKQAANIQTEIFLEDGDPLLSEARRKLRVLSETIEDPKTLELIYEQLDQNNKVVIVCNTVRKAMTMRKLLADYKPYLIHSRFTLGDRAAREDKAKIEEKMKDGHVIIATQVIEVSLDVSFNVMFTELSPADSLLQRFGRVNRHGDGKEAASVWVCCGEDKGSTLIYSGELLQATHDWMKEHQQERLDFAASLNWLQLVYPKGLHAQEVEAMERACVSFESVVSNLKPMLDPPADVDLEMNLFKSIQVVPSKFETSYTNFKSEGDHLQAKRLIVNVDLRAWSGAAFQANRSGEEIVRRLKIAGQKREVNFALCDYDEHTGLDLTQIQDQGDGNFW